MPRPSTARAPIRVEFSSPLAADSPWPTLSPSIGGSWKQVNSRTIEFVPVQGFTELTHVRLTIPAGPSGVKSAKGGLLATPVVQRFRTGAFSTLRLEQLLAQLGYLPLNWQPIPGDLPVSAADENGQLSAAYSPPAGTFLLAAGLPREAAELLGGRPAEPHPHRRGDGVRVRPRPDHGRRGRPRGLERGAQRGGQGPEQPARLHLRPGQPGEPGDADRLAQRQGDPAHPGQHRHPRPRRPRSAPPRSTCGTPSRS